MNDIEISKTCVKKNIMEIAERLGLTEEQVELYGKYKAKINFNDVMTGHKGKLVLVTAINPTPYGIPEASAYPTAALIPESGLDWSMLSIILGKIRLEF